MKKFSAPLLALFALCALCCTACNTSSTNARIQEKSEVFARLSPPQQKNIKEGAIEIGYSADMVYMALGHPAKVKSKDAPQGRVELWTYENYYPTISALQFNHTSAGRKIRPTATYGSYPREDATGQGSDSLFGADMTKPGKLRDMGPELSVDSIGDIPSHTLYVVFFRNRVFDIKLNDSDS